jgi:hypothetical protein
VPVPTLIRLNFIKKNIDNFAIAWPEKSCRAHFPFPAVRVVGKGPSDLGDIASNWCNQGYCNIVEGTPEVVDSIAQDDINALARLMKGIKNQVNVFGAPLVRFHPKFIEVRSEIGVDFGSKIINVFACSL